MNINLENASIEIQGDKIIISPKHSRDPASEFRSDMNIHKAIEDLKIKYIEEAERRCDGKKGKQTKVAEMLGFASYQAYAYWRKRFFSEVND